MNLGLHYENYGTPFNQAAFPAFAGFNQPINTVVRQKRDNDNFAPRVSFAYSPDFSKGLGSRVFGDKATVIRDGFAVNYDVFFNNILGNTAAASPNVASTTILGSTAFVGGNPRGLGSFNVNTLPTSATLNPLATITSIEPNLENPESYVYNLGIQRRLFGDIVMDVAYVGSRGLKLFINEQQNPFVNFTANRLNPSRGSVLLSKPTAAIQITIRFRFASNAALRMDFYSAALTRFQKRSITSTAKFSRRRAARTSAAIRLTGRLTALAPISTCRTFSRRPVCLMFRPSAPKASSRKFSAVSDSERFTVSSRARFLIRSLVART